MAEISNKTLAALLGGLIIISLASLLFTFTKLSGPGVTGYVSYGSGVANVTVVETTSIDVTDNFIDLGILEPGKANNSENVNDWFVMKNEGSVNLNISVYDSGSGPFSGTGCSSLPNSCYQVRGNSTQSGTIYGTYTNVPANVGSSHQVVSNLGFTTGQDTCSIGIQMTVPVDESAGDKTTTATLVAEKA